MSPPSSLHLCTSATFELHTHHQLHLGWLVKADPSCPACPASSALPLFLLSACTVWCWLVPALPAFALAPGLKCCRRIPAQTGLIYPLVPWSPMPVARVSICSQRLSFFSLFLHRMLRTILGFSLLLVSAPALGKQSVYFYFSADWVVQGVALLYAELCRPRQDNWLSTACFTFFSRGWCSPVRSRQSRLDETHTQQQALVARSFFFYSPRFATASTTEHSPKMRCL